MVYAKNEDGKTKSIIVTCNCGCGNAYEFKTYGQNVYIFLLNGDWYRYQTKIKDLIVDKAKDVIQRISKGKLYLKDIILRDNEIVDFLNAISSLKFEQGGEEEPTLNYAKIGLEYIGIDQEPMYSLYIKTKPSFSIDKCLLGKKYQACELCLTKTQWERFVVNCQRYYKKYNEKKGEN